LKKVQYADSRHVTYKNLEDLTGYIDWVYPDPVWDATSYSRKRRGRWESWAAPCDQRLRLPHPRRMARAAVDHASSHRARGIALTDSRRRLADALVASIAWVSNAHLHTICTVAGMYLRALPVPTSIALDQQPHDGKLKPDSSIHFQHAVLSPAIY
jgi:hypothetical protein